MTISEQEFRAALASGSFPIVLDFAANPNRERLFAMPYQLDSDTLIIRETTTPAGVTTYARVELAEVIN